MRASRCASIYTFAGVCSNSAVATQQLFTCCNRAATELYRAATAQQRASVYLVSYRVFFWCSIVKKRKRLQQQRSSCLLAATELYRAATAKQRVLVFMLLFSSSNASKLSAPADARQEVRCSSVAALLQLCCSSVAALLQLCCSK
jgi:hypothetical protein